MVHTCLIRRGGAELDMEVLVAGYNAQALAETKVYIARLHLSKLQLSLSFLPADWPRAPHPQAPPGGSGATPAAAGQGCWFSLFCLCCNA